MLREIGVFRNGSVRIYSIKRTFVVLLSSGFSNSFHDLITANTVTFNRFCQNNQTTSQPRFRTAPEPRKE